ncbi:MAG: hypothetical protein AAF560_24605 [Acidobacteriota bacterium]
MDAYRLSLKLYFEHGASPELTPYIAVFHRWIREHTLDHLLIDVADYSLVPEGPGIMLIGHEGHYSIDATDGLPGLVYAHKRPQDGSFAERLLASWQRLSTAARLLEQEDSLAAAPRLARDRLAFRINDRLLAPNTTDTLAAVDPDLRSLLREIYGDAEVELEHESDPRACFGVQVRTALA